MQRAKRRASFSRAGFSVIDYLPLTSHGKNSADIQLVRHAVEPLEHATRLLAQRQGVDRRDVWTPIGATSH